jgi:hypothetical protein
MGVKQNTDGGVGEVIDVGKSSIPKKLTLLSFCQLQISEND